MKTSRRLIAASLVLWVAGAKAQAPAPDPEPVAPAAGAEPEAPAAAAEPAPAPPASEGVSVDAPEARAEQWAPVVSPTLPVYDAPRARALYAGKCRVCHGAQGRGDGAVARYLAPKPRDFTRGVYKVRSTPTGTAPTHQDLFSTITRGLPGTGMLSWAGLSEEDRWQLVQLIMSLSPRLSEEPAEETLVVPPAPPSTPQRVERGKAVWAKMQCSKCHGEDGRGFGPAAMTTLDDQGVPSMPFDLARRESYRIGSAPEDLYRTLFTGLDGTAMPSYSGALSQEDAWDLVSYVRSLATPRR